MPKALKAFFQLESLVLKLSLPFSSKLLLLGEFEVVVAQIWAAKFDGRPNAEVMR